MKETFAPSTTFSISRDEIIGHPTYYRVSNLGIKQFKYPYDPQLIARIAGKAKLLKRRYAEKRHLNLSYIRGAHRYIPEILELVNWPNRQRFISDLAEVDLEPYPVSVISTTITFQGADNDGSIIWHADGIPVTEMVPLEIVNLRGGELEVFRGDYEEGMVQQRQSAIANDRIIRVEHVLGYSTLGQLMRTAHRVAPITSGHRITLNMNWRSREMPWIDDNTISYLAADNPDFDWEDEYLRDVRNVHVPAYARYCRDGG
jgi:hypothetical protein